MLSKTAYATTQGWLILEMRARMSKADTGNFGFYVSGGVYSFYPSIIRTGFTMADIGGLLVSVYKVAKGNPLTFIITEILGVLLTDWARSQLLLGIHPGELTNVVMLLWKPTLQGTEFIPLGVPHFVRVRVKHADLPTKIDYLEILEKVEDRPTPPHPYYALPEGFTYKDYRDITHPVTAVGAKVCTLGTVTERYRMPETWSEYAYLRVQFVLDDPTAPGLVKPLIVRLKAEDPAPGLGALALVCGGKSTSSQSVYDSAVVDTYVDSLASGFVRPMLGSGYSVIYGHEYQGDSNLAVSADCPVDLHIYDALGRHVGPVYDANGNVTGFDEQIPGAIYVYGEGDSAEQMIVPNPTEGAYSIQVRGTWAGEFVRTIGILNRSGKKTFSSTSPATPIQAGQTVAVHLAEIPAAPVGLRLTRAGEKLSLEWNDNLESDLVGYNVYRQRLGQGGFQTLNTSPVDASEFVDEASIGDFLYYVTAVDSSQNESGYLAPVQSRFFRVYLPALKRSAK